MNKLLSRTEYEEMVKKIPNGDCRLCNLKDQIMLGNSKYWFWIACLSPYWKYHTMLISKKHIEDIAELTAEEFTDLQNFYQKIKNHLLSLKIKHSDDKPIDQFMLMVRLREENIPGGSVYPKPKHLHIHFIPDREGAERFNLDSTAINIDIKSIALK